MYGYPIFRESYYPHTCLIIPEKDVLDTDISGTGFVSRTFRWWNDLFLLSYSSESSRSFYTSFHSMMIERYRQHRKYKNRIHPMSKFRDFWDFLILHVLIVKQIVLRFTSTFLFDKLPLSLFYFGAFLEFIIIWDLYVNMKTGFIDLEAKKVVLDTKLCLLNFCTTKLFLHVAAAIPLHWLMFLRYGSNIDCGLCKSNKFNCVLKIISTFGLIRVFETSSYWTKKSAKRLYFYKFLRIGAVGLITMSQFYDLSDVVCLLVFMNKGYVDKNSTLGMRSGFKYGGMGNVYPNYKYIFFDVSRVFKSLLLFSFGIRGKIYYLDKLASLIAFLMANGFYTWSILECYALVSRNTYPQDKLMRLRKFTLNLLSCRQLSDELRTKVEQYYDFKHTKVFATEYENELYRCLPTVLKREAKISYYMKLIMRIPLFTGWPIPVLEEVVLMLKKEVFLNNDIIAEAWVQGDGLMIVDNGVLAVYSQNYKELGHLIDGDYFGEISLVTDKELYMSFVVAITPCTILILDKAEFRMFMRGYPQLFYQMKTKLKAKYSNNVISFEHKDSQSSKETNKST